jgi:hypothetical protein
MKGRVYLILTNLFLKFKNGSTLPEANPPGVKEGGEEEEEEEISNTPGPDPDFKI